MEQVEPKEEPQAPTRAREMGENARARAEELWRWASHSLRKPAIGAGVAGATLLAAGVLWGAAEAAVAGLGAWAVFRTLRKRMGKTREPTHTPA